MGVLSWERRAPRAAIGLDEGSQHFERSM